MVIITLIMVIKMEIITFLKNNINARKIFGKRELKIIEKQLLGIKLSQSEKNRISRDIRPKFQFIKECARFSNDFKLKKGAKTKKVIENTKNVILEDIMFNNINKIIIFGSFVENQFTFKSDIDIAVLFNKINLKEATLFRKRVLGKVDKDVDIQIYNLLPQKIKIEIDTKGVTIYESK